LDLLGERLTSVTRRLRTPTSTEWRAGEYVDAGLAMIVSHNLAHRQRESLRQIASALGPGTITNAMRGYTFQGTPLRDVTDPVTYSGLTSISWDLQTSRRFGPFYAVRDRDVTDEPPTWRTVRVCLDVTASNLTVLACLTQGLEFPAPESYVAFESTTSTAWRTVLTLDLDPSRALAEAATRCRDFGGETEQSSAAACSLWVGWYGTSGTNSVWTISAHEVR